MFLTNITRGDFHGYDKRKNTCNDGKTFTACYNFITTHRT